MTERKSAKIAGSSTPISPNLLAGDQWFHQVRHQNLAINNAIAMSVSPFTLAFEKIAQQFGPQHLAINAIVASIKPYPSVLNELIQQFSHQSLAVNDTIAMSIRPLTVAHDQMIKQLGHQHFAINTAIAAAARFPQMDHLLASFAKASNLVMREHFALLAFFEVIDNSDLSSLDLGSIEHDVVSEAVEQFNKADSYKSFTSAFENLSPQLKKLFVFVFLHIFLPLTISISANLLMPEVVSHLENHNLKDREKIKAIKATPLNWNDVTTDGLRFISGNNVRLRAKPSIKSEALDELGLGQVVTVLSKERNWIEVNYTHENGVVMTGWVFTRYTAKFAR